MYDLSIVSNKTNSIKTISINNCDKDGSIVSARLASICNAVSHTRNLSIAVNRFTDSSYFNDTGNKIANYYKKHKSDLLNSEIVVLSSVHRAALYVAEVLHAILLPVQILSFARDIEEAKKSSLLSIVGSDYDSSYLWQWNKISTLSHFPSGYLNIIKKAKYLIIVRSNDKGKDCPIEGKIDNLFFNKTLSRLNHELWQSIKLKLKDKNINYDTLRQWEWGLPDSTIKVTKELWEMLGKDPANYFVIENSTENLYKLIPEIWEIYLNNNNVSVRGVTLNAYWIAHPYYERFAGLIPIHYYKFGMLKKIAINYINKFCISNWTPETFCVFINNIGHEYDSIEVIETLHELKVRTNFWFSIGFDCSDAKCTDVNGKEIKKPYEKVLEWIENTPYRNSQWNPISIYKVLEIVSNQNRDD